MANQTNEEVLYDFYLDVIVNEEGDLHFLADDKRVRDFFQSLFFDSELRIKDDVLN
jgi:hypothetical protein